ncbi:2'-5' RNA ligase family protein [Deinococcus maricopensis]|uniref:Phosphoesterase HXTX n=1 Tax=Deinococcus maricopensis (strain DSM 21211 / LMG 22137 / NRRL B-23946 / LB-34) TaxID=709986 RepID=E8U6F4_DEIML|nr:2'-5' RNA ligase family protein [Deinococcus maricopensis]ADV66643.1 Phosphoesterase HXTX [Deinococcus maricopensis DSM 21211]
MPSAQEQRSTASFLLGVLAPQGLSARVDAFRAASGASRESAAHVTVKARSGLSADLAWLESARATVAQAPAFEVRVGGAGIFPRRAVYLRVDSPGLVEVHVALLHALRPARRFGYEGPHMTPHLTLAQARRHLDLNGTFAQAQAAFADLAVQPFAFTVTALHLFMKPGPGGIYTPVSPLPLAT